jgi:hypothetical protein
LLHHLHAVTGTLASTLGNGTSRGEVLRAFAGTLRLNVIDTNLTRSSHLGFAATAAGLLTLLVAFVVVARHERARVYLFLALPILFTTLPLLIPDLLGGGQRVRNPRYFTSAYIYLDLTLAGLVYVVSSVRTRSRVVAAYAILIVLLASRAASSFVSSQATTWWNKMQDNSIAVADVIDSTPRPLIVSDAYIDYSLVLSNYLRPDIRVALRPSCYECANPAAAKLDASVLPPGHFTDIFAVGPSPQLQALLHSLIAQRHLTVAYHCVNVRHSCPSGLSIEPVFGVAGLAVPPSHPVARISMLLRRHDVTR